VRAGGGGGEGGATSGADRAARPRGALDARHRYGLPRMRLPRVYPIVESAAWVRRLAPLGVHLVQLRIKEQPREGLLEEIREAKACTRRSEEHTSELQSQSNLVCRLLLEKKNN